MKIFFFFYNIVSHKQILTKYCNHQEHTYYYLGGHKNTMLEQKLLEQINIIKILKKKRKVKKQYNNKVIMKNNNNNKKLKLFDCGNFALTMTILPGKFVPQIFWFPKYALNLHQQ